ncbi:MAG: RnfABCDGE type electron transport complex subunit B [Candidatus Coatesbacteria bacterium]|nr:RnfABCDGE type electron transport complex subunit B [Candidatus Coatesbacteria bacterium]
MLYALLVLGALGFVASAGLGVASKKLAIKMDPRIERLSELLPGANCGACGFAGCSNLAEAVINEGAVVTRCPVCDETTLSTICKELKLEAGARVKMVVRIMCSGGDNKVGRSFDYKGVRDCKAAVLIAGGDKNCPFGCLGYGTCIEVCPFGALSEGPSGIPVVDDDACTGCGKCVAACPKDVMRLVPLSNGVHVMCNSKASGKEVRDVCPVGCIGCGLCEKVCPFEAIEIVDNLAVIDYQKCMQCGLCVSKCPQKTISNERAFAAVA